MISISNKKKGFTLVELIMAMAILGIIAISFLHLFTSSTISLHNAGNLSKATAEAQSFLDKTYTDGIVYMETLDAADNTISKVLTASALKGAFVVGEKARYLVESVTISGKVIPKITVLLFYDSGKRSVVLSTLIPN
jgi:prepilin-type N-terminal cleavage/methylation domain-containing protein